MPTIVRGSCPHSQRRESRIIRGIATDIHSVHGLQWPGSLSRKFKSWPATRRSACLPATLTFHQKSRQPHLNVSCSPHPLSDTTCTRPCTRQNIAPHLREANLYVTHLFSMVPRGGLEPPRPCGLRILSPLRLPVSPSGLQKRALQELCYLKHRAEFAGSAGWAKLQRRQTRAAPVCAGACQRG